MFVDNVFPVLVPVFSHLWIICHSFGSETIYDWKSGSLHLLPIVVAG